MSPPPLAQLTAHLIAVLQDHLAGGGEATLLRAYDLGRSAVACRVNALEMIGIQQQALITVLLQQLGAQQSARLTQATSEVFAESLAPFELATRSSQEGSALLRQLNEVLELQVAERTAELQRERDFAERLIETAEIIVLVLGPDGRIVRLNPYLEVVSGYRLADVQGQDGITVFVAPQDQDGVRHVLARVMAGVDTGWGTRTFRTQAGEERSVACAAKVLKDGAGSLLGVLVVGHDITERQRAERAARQAEAQLRRLGMSLEHSWDAVIGLDLEARITSWNPAATRLYGYEAHEALGRVAPDLLIPDAIPDERMTTLQRVHDTRQRIYETQRRTKTGQILDVEIAFNPIYDEEGRLVGQLSISRDITARKAAEEALRMSLAEKELLLQEVHHRVKNNMQLISSLLHLQCQGIADPRTRGLFEDCQHRVRSMALIHEQLHRSPNLSRLDFSTYLHDLVNLLVRAYSQSSVRVHVEADAVPLDLDIAIPLGLILNELVSNALKHAFPDGSPGTLTIRLDAHDPQALCLVVQDDGIGMPAGLQWNTASTLGLKIIRALNSQLDGTLTMSNSNGTQITLCFPRPPVSQR